MAVKTCSMLCMAFPPSERFAAIASLTIFPICVVCLSSRCSAVSRSPNPSVCTLDAISGESEPAPMPRTAWRRAAWRRSQAASFSAALRARASAAASSRSSSRLHTQTRHDRSQRRHLADQESNQGSGRCGSGPSLGGRPEPLLQRRSERRPGVTVSRRIRQRTTQRTLRSLNTRAADAQQV